MLEIRFHGRGGQGAVIAAELLAHAAFRDGRVPQSFPFFGVERRGAPVTAFARIDDRPIGLRTSIVAPDIVVVLEPNLLGTQPVFAGVKSGGVVLVNSRRPPEELVGVADVRRASVDANAIAVAHGLGSATMPIVNTVMLGALARVSGAVSLVALGEAIEAHVPAKRTENRAAAEEGFRAVRTASPLPSAPAPSRASAPPPRSLPEGPLAELPTTSLHTSSWRTLRPVIHRESCTRCNFCWKFCPDVAIGFDPTGYPVLHPEHCKGCGICAAECPPKAIEMVSEA